MGPGSSFSRPCCPPPCFRRRQVAAYQSVIDLYKLRWVDFDIEGGAVAQPASINLRNRALKRIQVGPGAWGACRGRRAHWQLQPRVCVTAHLALPACHAP